MCSASASGQQRRTVFRLKETLTFPNTKFMYLSSAVLKNLVQCIIYILVATLPPTVLRGIIEQQSTTRIIFDFSRSGCAPRKHICKWEDGEVKIHCSTTYHSSAQSPLPHFYFFENFLGFAILSGKREARQINYFFNVLLITFVLATPITHRHSLPVNLASGQVRNGLVSLPYIHIHYIHTRCRPSYFCTSKCNCYYLSFLSKEECQKREKSLDYGF